MRYSHELLFLTKPHVYTQGVSLSTAKFSIDKPIMFSVVEMCYTNYRLESPNIINSWLYAYFITAGAHRVGLDELLITDNHTEELSL